MKLGTAKLKDECVPDESFLSASFDSLVISNSDSLSDATHVSGWRVSRDAFSSISSSASIDLNSHSSANEECSSHSVGRLSVERRESNDGDCSNPTNSNISSKTPFNKQQGNGKRTSILATANQDMLCTLNKMFSPQDTVAGGMVNLSATMPLPQIAAMAGGRSISANRSRTPSALTRHSSISGLNMTTAATTTAASTTASDKPKEPKKSQSKLLKVIH